MRRCVRILTSAAVRRREREGGRRRRRPPPVVRCLPDQDGKTGRKILWKGEKKGGKKTKTKQKVQRRRKREASSVEHGQVRAA